VKLLQRAQWCSVCSACIEAAREAFRPAPLALQQVIGHALRRLRADAGKTAQCLDKLVEAGR
jgi:hypothetical protein